MIDVILFFIVVVPLAGLMLLGAKREAETFRELDKRKDGRLK